MSTSTASDFLNTGEADEALPSYSLLDSQSIATRRPRTEFYRPTHVYLTSRLHSAEQGEKDWKDTKNDIPYELFGYLFHPGTKLNESNAGSSNVQDDFGYHDSKRQMRSFIESIVTGLREFLHNTRTKYYNEFFNNDNNPLNWGIDDDTCAIDKLQKDEPKIELEMNEVCKDISNNLVKSNCGDCRGLVVSNPTLIALNKIQRRITKNETQSCLIYSKSLNPTKRSWSISNYLGLGGETTNNGDILTQSPPKIRQYIDYSKIEALDETKNKLASLLTHLQSKISEKISAEEIKRSMKDEAKEWGVSVYPVDQGVLDELTSCDPMIITQTRTLSGGATS